MKKLKGNLYQAGETVTNYSEQSDYEQLPAGVYTCVITSVNDVADREYLHLEFDIAEGEHEGYFKRLDERANFWGGTVNLSYSEKNQKRSFQLPIKAINISNPGYIFNPYGDGANADEQTLVKKKIGIVLHEEEYKSKDGTIRTSLRTYPWGLVNIEKVATGDVNPRLLEKVPYVEATTPVDTFLNVPETETPFN